MKLSQLTARPQLVLITLDDEDIIKEYKEAIEFYTWDRQPMDTFMRLDSATQENTGTIVDIVKTLILDEHGQMILKDDAMLPTNVLMKAITRVTEMLGK